MLTSRHQLGHRHELGPPVQLDPKREPGEADDLLSLTSFEPGLGAQERLRERLEQHIELERTSLPPLGSA